MGFTTDMVTLLMLVCQEFVWYVQGMLSIGAAMLGSPHVIGIDIDDDALCTAQENCEQFEGLQVSPWHVLMMASAQLPNG